MSLEKNSPAGQGGACGHYAGDHGSLHTGKDAVAQGRARLARTVFVRQHGDGFRAEVEPHPRVKKGEAGFNRRFACLVKARIYAQGLSDDRGWPFVDDCAAIIAEPLPDVVRPISSLSEFDLGVNRLTRMAFRRARYRDAGDTDRTFAAALDAFAAGHVRGNGR